MRQLLVSLTLASLIATLSACTSHERGVFLFNLTGVPLAIGFSDAVGPCTDRFLTEGEINDASRDIAEGAWSPGVQWAVPEGSDQLWIIASDAITEVRMGPPPSVPPCGGEPPDWLPNG